MQSLSGTGHVDGVGSAGSFVMMAVILWVGCGSVMAWGKHTTQVSAVFDRLPKDVREGMTAEVIDWSIKTASGYPDGYGPWEPDRIGEEAVKTLLANGMKNRYAIHTEKGRAVVLGLLVQAIRDKNPSRVALWIAAYCHSVGDQAGANHDPMVHVSQYDWEQLLLPDGTGAKAIGPRMELHWLVSTPEGRAALDKAIEAQRLKDDGCSAQDFLVRTMLYGNEGNAYSAARGAKAVDAAIALKSDPKATAKLQDLMAEMDAWGVVRTLRDVDAAVRLAAAAQPVQYDEKVDAGYRQGVEKQMVGLLLSDMAIYDGLLSDAPAKIGIVLEPTWNMEQEMLGFTAYVNSTICRTLKSQGIPCRTLDIRKVVSQGLPEPRELPMVILTAAQLHDYWSLSKSKLLKHLAAYLAAGGKILWIEGQQAPPPDVCNALGAAPAGDGRWPEVMLQPGSKARLAVNGQSWPLARSPKTEAGWHQPGCPFIFKDVPKGKALVTLTSEGQEPLVVGLASEKVVVVPIYAMHPYLFGEMKDFKISARPTLDPAGQAVLDAAIAALGIKVTTTRPTSGPETATKPSNP